MPDAKFAFTGYVWNLDVQSVTAASYDVLSEDVLPDSVALACADGQS